MSLSRLLVKKKKRDIKLQHGVRASVLTQFAYITHAIYAFQSLYKYTFRKMRQNH